MQIFVDGAELFTISDTRKKVICDSIPEDIFEQDIKRRLKWVVEQVYTEAFSNLKSFWSDKLAERVDSLPSDADKYANLIFSQPDYKSKYTRDQEQEAETQAKISARFTVM